MLSIRLLNLPLDDCYDFWRLYFLFLVVAKLYSHVITDTAESSRLHLPVPDWVVKETDAIVEDPLHSKTCRAEVIHPDLSDVVWVEVDNLQKLLSGVLNGQELVIAKDYNRIY